MSKYYHEAKSDALEMFRHFRDQIVKQIVDDQEVSDDFYNDYDGGDSYHHECHVDRPYDLQESAAILDELSEYEETDSGLWESRTPIDAIAVQAAYTYGNAVWSMTGDMISEINEAIEDRKEEFDELEGQDTELGVLASEIVQDVIFRNKEIHVLEMQPDPIDVFRGSFLIQKGTTHNGQPALFITGVVIPNASFDDFNDHGEIWTGRLTVSDHMKYVNTKNLQITPEHFLENVNDIQNQNNFTPKNW